ncbi:MAG: ligase D protein [Parcubacteria group bacterium GW2011_GWE2_39_37]|uniref:DNA ligase (ATP) n=1 Tax=Candidatus Falkowbacteria bacterium GW2011_GWF2_39_8 TaxID=1618642 RepID=A0A0G0PX91_9BACT|nr:MAG: ligase D protein [Parcubacteria group bacterium GW2011_GWE2_39_37]KKR32523.1 MAG: ligase D protein [Candidatus Falkowbacteria bacterium GW2011_GWF2_39_8]
MIGKIPDTVSPMLAKSVDRPFDKGDWFFEIKFDGYRIIAIIDRRIDLYSRNKLLYTEKFPAIVKALEKLPAPIVLDGEVVVLDDKGKADFKLLQNHLKTGSGYPIYFVFDLLFYGKYDLRGLQLRERKKILKDILPEFTNIRYADHIEKEGKNFFSSVAALGIEGVMAKNSLSGYVEGQRTDDWLKVKNLQTQEAIICGFTAPRKGRKHLGSLVLGVYESDRLVYAGHSGGGFNETELAELKSRLMTIRSDHSPFELMPKTNAQVTWVEPKLVCEIRFTEWTDDGSMRHPVFVGLREDKRPKEVVREVPQKVSTLMNNHEEQGFEKFSNLDKVLWPNEGHTKKDVLDYYEKLSDYILPYLKDRPENLHRFPHGIDGPSFYQKNNTTLPAGIESIKILSDTENKEINYLLCQNKETLLYMVNLGCIEINPWNSRIQSLDHPDYLILDLDPLNIGFKQVVKAALATNDILKKIEVKAYCKTSGLTGLHIFIPLQAKYDYEQARRFALIINMIVSRNLSKITSLKRMPAQRTEKVYLDYLQNRRGQTLASAYSLRPEKGAPISMPLAWSEVNENLNPKSFNIFNALSRIKKYGDLWQGVLGEGIKMDESIERLEKMIKNLI